MIKRPRFVVGIACFVLPQRENFPESTIIPPIEVPCPPIYFVKSELQYLPQIKFGVTKVGFATVLSTMTATPFCGHVTNRSKINNIPAGSDVSQYTALVCHRLTFQEQQANHLRQSAPLFP
ncbi:MAG: hypothetical protein Ct9H90mP25_1890 [Gammaproteobacteria bacterium]|nr:MAG: hypothetical protein Ct9H90mP25_1890 [Gammaproteobacteria bacterium]